MKLKLNSNSTYLCLSLITGLFLLFSISATTLPIQANQDKSTETKSEQNNTANELSKEDATKVLKFLKKYRPALYTQLEQLNKPGKEKEFNDLVQRIAAKTMYLVKREEKDPKGFQLLDEEHKHNTAANNALRKIRRAKTQTQIDILMKELKTSLEKAYDARIKIQEYELTKLEARLKRVRAQIQDQRKNKQQYIEQKLKQAESRVRK